MDSKRWTEVDDYLTGRLLTTDAALDEAIHTSAEAGLPAIQVTPNLGKLLNLIARTQGARRILEIGTLGGYSTIWLARALPERGRLVTLELSEKHAEVAAANLERAEVSDLVDLQVGPAADSLASLITEGAEPFDLVFIDADKQSTADYFRQVLDLSRVGTLIIVDNVVRAGAVADPESEDAATG